MEQTKSLKAAYESLRDTKLGFSSSNRQANQNSSNQTPTPSKILVNKTPTTSRNTSLSKLRIPIPTIQESQTSSARSLSNFRQLVNIESVELTGNGNMLRIKGILDTMPQSPQLQEIQSARVRPRIKTKPLGQGDLIGDGMDGIEERGFKTERSPPESRLKKSNFPKPKALPPLPDVARSQNTSRRSSRNKNLDLEESRSIIRDVIDQLGTLQGQVSPASSNKNKTMYSKTNNKGAETPSRFKPENRNNQWSLPTEAAGERLHRTSRTKKDFRDRVRQDEGDGDGCLVTERSERTARSSGLMKKKIKGNDFLLSEGTTPYGLRPLPMRASPNLPEGFEIPTVQSIDALRFHASPSPGKEALKRGKTSSFQNEIEDFGKMNSPREPTPQTGENELFMRQTKTFFKLNPKNKKLQEYRELYEGKQLDYEEVYEKPPNIHPEVLKGIQEIEKLRSNQNPISLLFNSGKKLVQPSYMKDIGTMCYTELWGSREAIKAVKQLEKKGPFVRLFPERDEDFLFKPDKWEEKADLERKKAFEIPDSQIPPHQVEEAHGKPDQSTKDLLKELSNMPILHSKFSETHRDQNLRLSDKRSSMNYHLSFNAQMTQDSQETSPTPLLPEKKMETFLSRTINKQRKTLFGGDVRGSFMGSPLLPRKSQHKGSPVIVISEEPKQRVFRSEEKKKPSELINAKDHLTKSQKINNLLQIMADEKGAKRGPTKIRR